MCGNVGILQIHKSGAFVAWQGEDGGVHVGMDMPPAKLLVEALQGAFRAVVVLTQMAQHDVFHAGMIDFGHKLGRLVIAQMAKRSGDALFQDIRIRAFLQHLHVVVRLEDEVVGTTDLFLHHLVEHPDVGGDGQGTALIIKMIAYRPSPIVHHGEGLYGDAA